MATLDTFAPPVAPSSLPLNVQPRMLSAALGDGYTVSAPDGLNVAPLNATLSWTVLSAEQNAAILAFLNAHLGVTFLYTLPSETTPRKWQATTWTPKQQPSWFTLDVLIVERFDLNAY